MQGAADELANQGQQQENDLGPAESVAGGFTALTGGSGVTILALGGLLLPMLVKAGCPEQRGIGLVTSASALAAAWAAKWELAAPVVAIGSLGSGLATPTESAALTASCAVATQALAHREMNWRLLESCLADCAKLIGSVMLILGMALALNSYLVDAGIPDAATVWVQAMIPNKVVFLIVLCLFLFAAAALMEIYAAIVMLAPLLLPLALAYGIDPVHFAIISLAAMEVGYLCPPAGPNIYFASAMFGKSIRCVAFSVLPAMGAIFVGTLVIALVPALATGLPSLLAGRGGQMRCTIAVAAISASRLGSRPCIGGKPVSSSGTVVTETSRSSAGTPHAHARRCEGDVCRQDGGQERFAANMGLNPGYLIALLAGAAHLSAAGAYRSTARFRQSADVPPAQAVFLSRHVRLRARARVWPAHG